MPMDRDVSLAKMALISILLFVLLAAGPSAQSQSPESQSGQWRIAGQNLSNTGASRQSTQSARPMLRA